MRHIVYTFLPGEIRSMLAEFAAGLQSRASKREEFSIYTAYNTVFFFSQVPLGR